MPVSALALRERLDTYRGRYTIFLYMSSASLLLTLWKGQQRITTASLFTSQRKAQLRSTGTYNSLFEQGRAWQKSPARPQPRQAHPSYRAGPSKCPSGLCELPSSALISSDTAAVTAPAARELPTSISSSESLSPGNLTCKILRLAFHLRVSSAVVAARSSSTHCVALST